MAKKKDKPRGNTDEILVLVMLRRQRAREAMRSIVECFRNEHDMTVPNVADLWEYVSQMTYCIELCMKLLSGDWNNHAGNAMYKAVFGKDHSKPEFLDCLNAALRDQKYLFQPAMNTEKPGTGETIVDFIDDMEMIFKELVGMLYTKHRSFNVNSTVVLPERVARYIANHAKEFVSPPRFDFDPRDEANRERTEEVLRQHAAKVAGHRQAILNEAEAYDGVQFMELFGGSIECIF